MDVDANRKRASQENAGTSLKGLHPSHSTTPHSPSSTSIRNTTITLASMTSHHTIPTIDLDFWYYVPPQEQDITTILTESADTAQPVLEADLGGPITVRAVSLGI